MDIISKRFFTSVILLITLVVLLIPGNTGYAADKNIPYHEVSYNFYDIFFLDDQNGWICGKSGYLFRTKDGGKTWDLQKTGTYNSIFGVEFVTPDRGFLVGQTGLAMKTEDGGETWEKMEIPLNKTFLTLDFYDEMTGMAVGDWGKIIITKDGGKSWQDKSLAEDIVLYDVLYIGPEDVWIAAEMGTLLHSTDGGENWEQMPIADGTFFGVDFDDKGNGVATAIGGMVYYTHDAGVNWESNKISEESVYNAKINGKSVLAIGDAGTIFIQDLRDLDKPWRQIEVPILLKANWLRCVEVIGEDKFIIAGVRGSIRFIAGGELINPTPTVCEPTTE